MRTQRPGCCVGAICGDGNSLVSTNKTLICGLDAGEWVQTNRVI